MPKHRTQKGNVIKRCMVKECNVVLVVDKNTTQKKLDDSKYRCTECTKPHHKKYELTRDPNRDRNEDKDAKAERKAMRRALELQAFPSWGCRKAIRRIYKIRNYLNRRYGPNTFHVDHIVPLKGEKVSGFHIACNLQILTAEENLRKGNTYECV
jgi:hypothetical protein